MKHGGLAQAELGPRREVGNELATSAAVDALGRASKTLRTARKAFLQRRDAAALHGLRVAIRRLRASLTLFRPALDLPERLGDRSLQRFGRGFAELSDLDVSAYALGAADHVASIELARVLRRRRREVRRVERRLRGKRARRLLRALRQFLEKPRFRVTEQTPATHLVPPLRARAEVVDRHPAWDLALVVSPTGRLRSTDPAWDDDAAAELIHELRRRLKRIRYQMEAAALALGRDWSPALTHMEDVQRALGTLQDARVMSSWIEPDPVNCRQALNEWNELRVGRLAAALNVLFP